MSRFFCPNLSFYVISMIYWSDSRIYQHILYLRIPLVCFYKFTNV